MLSNIGFPGLILILVLALIIFGPNKLPEIGRAFGKTLKEFKSATKGLTEDEEVSVAPKQIDVPHSEQPSAGHPVPTDSSKQSESK